VSTYVLCHGSWYTPSPWERISECLAAADHEAIAVTYPGDVGDQTPGSQVTSSPTSMRCEPGGLAWRMNISRSRVVGW
jgi:poly(3-hydroxybutyrate) depolymerase